ncbi:hypothetical protein [Streptomyces nanshensis]|uniref:Uncharacterized protein n=1 Tax=Streptomyces nanshensis TaxID=518642 RepID=A0A1E7KZ90_9ACTN|nr:hypothetical protein [Streptomyces nanshensis]OEV09268.1 hypothetical protein AN218_22710 [Streptomyces nanshensis]
MINQREITVEHIRDLLAHSDDGSALCLIGGIDGDIEVRTAADIPSQHGVIITREQASEVFGEHHPDGLDDATIDELLDEASEGWMEQTREALAY